MEPQRVAPKCLVAVGVETKDFSAFPDHLCGIHYYRVARQQSPSRVRRFSFGVPGARGRTLREPPGGDERSAHNNQGRHNEFTAGKNFEFHKVVLKVWPL